jgi:hypothetical protein
MAGGGARCCRRGCRRRNHPGAVAIQAPVSAVLGHHASRLGPHGRSDGCLAATVASFDSDCTAVALAAPAPNAISHVVNGTHAERWRSRIGSEFVHAGAPKSSPRAKSPRLHAELISLIYVSPWWAPGSVAG